MYKIFGMKYMIVYFHNFQIQSHVMGRFSHIHSLSSYKSISSEVDKMSDKTLRITYLKTFEVNN